MTNEPKVKVAFVDTIKEVEENFAKPDTEAYVVCVLDSDPLMVPDNVRGVCALCGSDIQFRPTAPRNAKKICMKCYGENLDEHEVIISRETVREAVHLSILGEMDAEGKKPN